jgi:hypothetical protein
LIGRLGVALAHGAGGGDGGFFDYMDEVAQEIALDAGAGVEDFHGTHGTAILSE